MHLTLLRERDFQPDAWPDVPFQGCRNASVWAQTHRRADLAASSTPPISGPG